MATKKYPFLLSDLDDLPTGRFGPYEFVFDPNLCPISTKISQEVLKETDEKKDKCIQELRKLLEQEDDLVVPVDNVDWFVKFLRARDYDVPETFKLIKKYYRFKIKYSEMYKDFIPSKMTRLYEHQIFLATPEKDDQGRRILILEVGKKWKHKIVSVKELFRVCILIMEAASLEPTTQVLGAVVIIDVKGFNLARANRFTPQIIRMGIKWIEDCVPVKIQAFHIVNENTFVDIVWNLAKTVLRPDFKKRIHFHGTDWESLKKHIPERCLFTWYGGSLVLPPIPTHDELVAEYGLWAEKADKEFQAINSYGYRK